MGTKGLRAIAIALLIVGGSFVGVSGQETSQQTEEQRQQQKNGKEQLQKQRQEKAARQQEQQQLQQKQQQENAAGQQERQLQRQKQQQENAARQREQQRLLQQQRQEKAARRQQEQRETERRLSEQRERQQQQIHQQRLEQHRRQREQQDRLERQRRELLERQRRQAQLRYQQRYLDHLREDRLRLESWRYTYAPPQYRYYRGGRYYQASQYAADLLRQAVRYGYEEGVRVGQSDREDRWRFRYQDSYPYQDATFGYNGYYVSLDEYRYYFRQGFRRGYDDGYYGRWRYGSHSDGTFSLLGNILLQILRLQSLAPLD
jgi:hypothetical protein